MIQFSQSSGKYHFVDGDTIEFLGCGWSGNGNGKNNPEMQHFVGIGPLPRGIYKMIDPVKHPRLGYFAIKLMPNSENEMFGRNDFWIHGPSLSAFNHGQESKGCPIADRLLREKIWLLSKKGELAFVVIR